jgi:hypothetical protein
MGWINARWAGAAAMLLAMLLPCGASAAGPGSSAVLRVTATVQRFATVRVAVPTTLTISRQDVDRGYVEVAAPLHLSVRSNVAQGYRLVLKHRGALVRNAVVHGLPEVLVVDAAGATVARPAAGHGIWQESLQLHVRFALSPHVQPGTHDWPLQISALSE